MGEPSRERIEDLVRQATLAFYDESTSSELAGRVDVDYLTHDGDGHRVMVFAESHEYEHERPVWAEIGDVRIDLEPEQVGVSSYHVHVELSDAAGVEVGRADRDPGPD